MQTNQQLELAFQYVQYTNKNIFLTGKAGTGKTTFLHNLKTQSPKRMVIVAPTGVAAINAGGVTIHSFFQLPFGPYISESLQPKTQNSLNSVANNYKFRREKIRIIKGMDLLVIDEISMVRADMLDGIDDVLRKYKDRTKPFGGIQLLMIGDLHQLSPVVKDEEWNLLRKHYETAYFFSSKALKQSTHVSIELQHIFRQSDKLFIDMLNEVRTNNITPETLEKLNERYIPNFNPNDKEGYITLTTHNVSAQTINNKKLDELKNKSHFFRAEIKDDFPAYAYPTEENLELKIGAQVMFVKNDLSREKLYYNGKIGTVVRIDDQEIYIKCPSDYEEILVSKSEWHNVKYSLDEDTKLIKEIIIGKFIQFPLKLAWAITIHKSQGLTFEKAIIDANASFAHGQVYVALSRCKTFGGLVLSTPIMNHSVKTDGTISEFTEEINRNIPTESQLQQSKIDYQKSILYEIFDLKLTNYYLRTCDKILYEHESIIDTIFVNEYKKQISTFDIEVIKVANKFKNQLDQLTLGVGLPEENSEIQERVKKASGYFAEKIDNGLLNFITNTFPDTDNATIKKSLDEVLEKLQKELTIKSLCMKSMMKQFNIIEYLRVKSNTDLDFKKPKVTETKPANNIPNNISHPELYSELRAWRDELAEQGDVSSYMILPFKVLLDLTEMLPTTFKELETIKGIGKTKVKQFGTEIIEIISNYIENKGVVKPEIEISIKVEKEKIDTKKLSFDLYKSGKTVEEVAKERGFAVSTIEGHLSNYVVSGEIDIKDFVSNQKIEIISEFLKSHPGGGLGEAKLALGETITYPELKFVQKYLEFLNKEIE